MGEVTNQIAIVLGVLVACFAGPAAALFVLIRRKAKARQSRRSPIGIALLRGPGHSLREQLDEAHNDLTWDLVLLMVVPLLALALFLAQSHLRGLPQTAHRAPVYALAAIAFIVYMLRQHGGQKLFAWALTLILGGAIGNVIDRLLHGYVVDFIQVHYGGWYFPAFNLADSAITLGAICLILDEILRVRHSR